MANIAWTEERVRILRRWWGKGKSAREIALMCGMSRNAVIGKAQRLCAAKTKPKAKPPRAARQRPRLVASEPPVVIGRVTMAELTFETCRYPFGEIPRFMTFCGAPVQAGSSYCPLHHAACWDAPPGRKSARQAAGSTRGDFQWPRP